MSQNSYVQDQTALGYPYLHAFVALRWRNMCRQQGFGAGDRAGGGKRAGGDVELK